MRMHPHTVVHLFNILTHIHNVMLCMYITLKSTPKPYIWLPWPALLMLPHICEETLHDIPCWCCHTFMSKHYTTYLADVVTHLRANITRHTLLMLSHLDLFDSNVAAACISCCDPMAICFSNLSSRFSNVFTNAFTSAPTYMYIYIYILYAYTHIHTCMHAFICSEICMCIHRHMHVPLRLRLLRLQPVRLYTHTCTCTWYCAYTLARACA